MSYLERLYSAVYWGQVVFDTDITLNIIIVMIMGQLKGKPRTWGEVDCHLDSLPTLCKGWVRDSGSLVHISAEMSIEIDETSGRPRAL